MVYYLGGYKKGIAIDLRKKGFSYDEIKNKLNIPKSTVVSWVKKIKLGESQIQNLKNKKLQAARDNSKKRSVKILKQVEEIRRVSIKSIDQISKRELWLMGIVLYWRHKSLGKKESNFQKGVWFSSADPSTMNLFLRWLKDVGGVTNEELYFDIFMGKDKKKYRDEVVDYWSGSIGLSRDYFKHIYYQNTNVMVPITRGKGIQGKFGFLRVRVRASSMLARQIGGWIEGIKKYYA